MKTFLSIGTGPGIGITTAERFASERFRLVLSARDVEKCQQFAASLRAKGVEVHVRAVDAADVQAVSALVESVREEFGEIDVLHYNAANLRHATLEEQPAASFNTDLAVNIGGALAVVKSAGRHMKARKTGTILLTGGGFALAPHPEYISISIGKAGIRALAQGLFDDYKSCGVHVGTVTVAGFVEAGTSQITDIADRFWQLHAQPQESWTVEEIYHP